MKVALVCDWLTEVGGAEKVLLEFHKLFPDALIYTSQYREGRIDWFKGTEIKTGYLQHFPVWTRRLIAPLRQNYFKNLDLSEYDLVISVTGCDAKLIKTNGIHLCYCHVPTQYYWGKRDEYLKNPGFGILNPLARSVFKKMLPKLRETDYAAAKNPDKYLTISNYAKQEIKTFYKREASIVNPPVNTDIFAQVVDNYNTKKRKSQTKKLYNKTIKMQISQAAKSEQKFCTNLQNVENLGILAKVVAKYPDGFYLNFSRQVNWKRLDLAVKCCKKLNMPLVLVGNGPENSRLKKLAKGSDSIMFIDSLPQTDLAMLASLAKAFIFPSEEPFGIAPVEALSAGCPVIAYKGGGALDYIKDGKNGVFFDKQDEKSLEKILKKFDRGDISLNSPQKISKSVEKYSSENFVKNIKNEIETLSKKSKKNTEKAHKNPSPKKLFVEKMKTSLLLCSPLVFFLSFFPSLNLGENSSMHFKLSLPLLWLALFSILNIRSVLKYIKKNLKTPLIAFPIIAVISFFDTTNPVRGLFTLATLACLFVSIVGINEHIKKASLSKNFKKIIIIETVAVCIFCLAQSFFDAIGVSRGLTLLCQNCASDVFGFPHPNGFAIEPQFMGSLLIAPIFLALNSLLENKNKKSQISLTIGLVIIMVTLFLTLSRGAIYAVLIALIILILSLRKLKNALKIALITIGSFIISLCIQGSLAVLGPTNTSFKDAISTVISQLTIGKINLKTTETNGEFSEPAIETTTQNTPQTVSKTPTFTSFVAESSNRRLELATFATKIALDNPTNTLFGTGLGSAGTEMYVHFPEKQGHEKEIVQNEYLEALLEIGIIGIIFLALSIVTFIKLEKFKFEPYTFATVVAFAISICFFSGFPNTLHVYLLPVLWYNLMYDKNRIS